MYCNGLVWMVKMNQLQTSTAYNIFMHKARAILTAIDSKVASKLLILGCS